jgi:hypothetical protein
MSKSHKGFVWNTKPIFAYSKATGIVLNTWEDIGFDEYNVEIMYITYLQINDETLAKDMNFRLDLNGVTITASAVLSADNNAPQTVGLAPHGDTDTLTLGTTYVGAGTSNIYQFAPLSAKHINNIQLRTETAVGTNQTFKAWIRYRVKESRS